MDDGPVVTEDLQDLCKRHPTFRERSEEVDLAVEISLQPWEAFQPDGVILFSDILTPLSGMNIPFDIVKGTGPIMNPVAQWRCQGDKRVGAESQCGLWVKHWVCFAGR